MVRSLFLSCFSSHCLSASIFLLVAFPYEFVNLLDEAHSRLRYLTADFFYKEDEEEELRVVTFASMDLVALLETGVVVIFFALGVLTLGCCFFGVARVAVFVADVLLFSLFLELLVGVLIFSDLDFFEEAFLFDLLFGD